MKSILRISLLFCALGLCLTAIAGELHDGILMVEGEPFYPVGSWNHADTSPDDIARLGMNVSFMQAPEEADKQKEFEAYTKECGSLGIQVIPYLAYGGARYEPWPDDTIKRIARLSQGQNVLAWYIGDDIDENHLDGIRHTTEILRQVSPKIPIAADYIGARTEKARTVYREYVDIHSQYFYPIPHDPYARYFQFFEDDREYFGDPLWTWVQVFMWGFTGDYYGWGDIGPSPLPDPEQVRLMSYAAINRNVRGQLFFPHHSLSRQPEIAGETALLCHELRLAGRHLAGGEYTSGLPVSIEEIDAAVHHYKDSAVLSVALFKPNYHSYVDEGIVKNFTVDCPWPYESMPNALMFQAPDIIRCNVEKAGDKTIRITIPQMELTGLVFLSANEKECVAFINEAKKIPYALRKLALPAAVAQARKVSGVVWQVGLDTLIAPRTEVRLPFQEIEKCADALDAQDYAEVFRSWRRSFRATRNVLAMAMNFAEEKREMIPAKQVQYLSSPYGLHKIDELGKAPIAGDPWHFVRRWKITGPFPLEWNQEEGDAIPPGFERDYGPETTTDPQASFETMDGLQSWRQAECSVSGLLNPALYFQKTDNVVCYAQCKVIAPQAIKTQLSIGSNDGSRVWLNGEQIYSMHIGRSGTPHDDTMEVELKQGENTILVKVANYGRSWKLYLSLHDPERILTFLP